MNRLAVLVLIGAAVSTAAAGCGGGGDVSGTGASTAPAVSGSVPFDQAFIDAMVPHHREAIEMSVAADVRGLTQPDLQKVATNIVGSQQKEIEQMLGWRERWFGSRTLGPVLPEVLGVPASELGMGHGSADEVSGAVDLDATFAAMMIAHHEGAIAMAEAAQGRGQHAEIKRLATAIIEAQEREIEIMKPHATGEHHG